MIANAYRLGPRASSLGGRKPSVNHVGPIVSTLTNRWRSGPDHSSTDHRRFGAAPFRCPMNRERECRLEAASCLSVADTVSDAAQRLPLIKLAALWIEEAQRAAIPDSEQSQQPADNLTSLRFSAAKTPPSIQGNSEQATKSLD